MKHESSTISLKCNYRHALKDISESLVQLPNSKDISEAQRVFSQIMNKCVSLSKGVSRKDDCGRLKCNQIKYQDLKFLNERVFT